jgi:hypothetical protein
MPERTPKRSSPDSASLEGWLHPRSLEFGKVKAVGANKDKF